MYDILYENNEYIVTLLSNKFSDDKFKVLIYNNLLSIQRVDTKCGWYQDVILNIYYKLENKHKLLHVGKSDLNALSIPIDDSIKQIKPAVPICVGMAVVPPRFNSIDFLYRINHILYSQTYLIDKLYITIPKTFNRFQESLDSEILDQLSKLQKVEIIETPIDYGPASKFLGPLIYEYNYIYNKFLVCLDDDRYYNNYLIENLFEAHMLEPNIKFVTSDWLSFFDHNYINLSDRHFKTSIEKRYMPGGFAGFALSVSDKKFVDSIIEYSLYKLNNVKDVFLHDEGVLLGYINKHNLDVLVVSHKHTYDSKKEEESYALCKDAWIRKNIENNIIKDDKINKLYHLLKVYNTNKSINSIDNGDTSLGVVSDLKSYDALLYYNIFSNDTILKNILNNFTDIHDIYLLGSNIKLDQNQYNISYIDRSIDCTDNQFATNTNYMIYKYQDIFLFLNLGTDVAVKWLLDLPTLKKFKQLVLCFYDFIDGDIDSYIYFLNKINKTHDLVYTSISSLGFSKEITNKYKLSNVISLTFIRR